MVRADSESDADPTVGGRLVVAVPTESNGLNPYLNQWGDSPALMGSTMYEPLAIQEDDGTARPWLAESWTPNADFTQWDIVLRPNVFFHDDTPFNAVAAKRNLDKMITASFYSLQFGPLYDRVEVTGELSLRVFLKVRWAVYPTSLVYAWMVAPSVFLKPDEGVKSPVGTGPFRFQHWTQFQSLSVVRFDRYWRRDDRGHQLPHLAKIDFLLMPDDDARIRALQRGEVDLTLNTGVDIARSSVDSFQIVKDYGGQRTFMLLNTGKAPKGRSSPFVNVHARRAVAYATDRQRISRVIGPDVESTTHGYRPDSPWAPIGGDGYVAYDPAAARRELDLYRKDTGADKLTFSVNVPNIATTQAAIQELQRNLAEVGIVLQPNVVENAKVGTLSAMGSYEAAILRSHDFTDPDQANFYYSSASAHPVGDVSPNLTRYTSRRLDENLKVLRESPDLERRRAANTDLIRETNEQVIDIWLYNTPASLVARSRVRGLDGFRTHHFASPVPKPWLAEVHLG